MTTIKNNQNIPKTFSLLVSTPFKSKVLEWATQASNAIVVTFNRGPWQNAAYVGIDTVDVKSLDDLRDLANEMRSWDAGRVIIFDGLDDLQALLMNARLAEKRREEFGTSDWNWLAEQTSKVVSGFSNKGHYFIATCGLGHQNGITKVGLIGSAAWEVPKMMTYTLLYDQTTPEYGIREGEPVLSTEGGAYFFRTGPSLQAPWVTDYTETLPLQFFGSLRDLAVAYNEFQAARLEVIDSVSTTSTKVETPVSEKTTIKLETEANQIILAPGMSSNDEIEGLFGN